MLTDDLRVAPGLDIWLVPNMAQGLGFDPTLLQTSLVKNYESVGEGDDIQWGKPQWVKGDNRALRYRGNVLKREKMWFQLNRPSKTGKFLRYLYTGWQWRVLPATAGVEDCEEMIPVVKSLNDWTKANGYAEANHFIVTRYRDGDHNIGAHFDKDFSIMNKSLITIIKLGEVGRPFKLEWLDGKVIFEKVLPPGTGVVMTLEANLKTKHSVPSTEKCGDSGSIVARTIVDEVTWDETKSKINKANEAASKLAGKRKAE